jgi:hypothetical protein
MIGLLLLALQAPALEELRSAEVDSADVTYLKSSQTGKYLILGRVDKVEVYTTADLKLAKTFEMPWTIASFDENDEHLVVVGIELVRYRPSDWKEISRNALQDADFRKFQKGLMLRQAWIYPDGAVLYRSKGGGVRQADWDTGKLVTKSIVTPEDNPEHFIQGIVSMSPQTLILDLDGHAGILHGTSVASLILSDRTFFAQSCNGVTVLVGKGFEGIYNSNSWRIVAARVEDWEERDVPQASVRRSSEGIRTGAAIDQKSGWTFVAGTKGLRAWDPLKFETVQRYAAAPDKCLNLALDNRQRLLYTLETGKIRCWKIKDP